MNIPLPIIWSGVFLVFGATAILSRLAALGRAAINWDESTGLVVAQRWAMGGVPYKAAFDNKTPFFFLIFRAMTALSGTDVFWFRILTGLYVALTALAICMIGYLIANELLLGFVAGFFYILFMGYGPYDGIAVNGEVIMLLPASLSLLLACYWKYRKPSGRPEGICVFLSGVLGGLCLLTKTTGFFSILVLPAFFISARGGIERGSTYFKRLSILASGGAATLAATVLYFAANGALHDLVFATWTFNRRYMNTLTLRDGVHNFLSMAYSGIRTGFIGPLGYCMILVLLGYVVAPHVKTGIRMERNRKYRDFATLVLLLFVSSCIGAFWGRNLFLHYMLQLALPMALATGLVIKLVARQRGWLASSVAGLLLVGCVYAHSAQIHEDLTYIGKNTLLNQGEVERQVASYLRDHTAPDDTIFVFGGQPVIYFLSERYAPTRFFFWILFRHRFADILDLDQKKEAEDALNNHPPKYWVFQKPWEGMESIDSVLTGVFDKSRKTKVAEFGSYEIFKSEPI